MEKSNFQYEKLYYSTNGVDIVILKYIKYDIDFDEFEFEMIHVLNNGSDDIGNIGEKIHLSKDEIDDMTVKFRSITKAEKILYGK